MPVALVTGASTGLGRELALLCARAGYDVAAVARNEAQLATLASEIRAAGREAHIAIKDLALPESPAQVYERFGGLDVEVLINNAGLGLRGHFAALDVDAQMRMLQLNVNALTHLTRLFLPAMVARRRGYVMNVASTAAFQPGPLMAVYYASKAYVLSLSEALHNEVEEAGVTVTALCPGPTRTEFSDRAGMGRTRLFSGGNVMDASEVARAGFEGMMAGRAVVVPGVRNRLMAFSTRLAPRSFAARLARGLQE